nr:MAG TPA: hypothetical protein [Caudoviricetes sp.]
MFGVNAPSLLFDNVKYTTFILISKRISFYFIGKWQKILFLVQKIVILVEFSI